MAIEYPARISLAQTPTPLQLLPRVSELHGQGHRIWVKRDDLTGAALSGNKIRKLEFVAAAAREQGCDTLITCGGVQSNHCRATALVGAQLGFHVHLLLRGDAPQDIDGNLLLDHLAGATISHHAAGEFASDNLDQLFADWQNHYASQGRKVYSIPTGASNGVGIWGYIAAAEELQGDLQTAAIANAHVVCATGSGGTQAGLTLGAALHDVPVHVWGINVCDDESWFIHKVAADIADWQRRYQQVLPEPAPVAKVIDGYVGPGYGRATREIFELIAEMARLEGLVLDPVYTGKAFYGMLQEIGKGRFSGCEDIVFVHTGGIYGVFPQRHNFSL
jgi:D-cysteine desulfhydrase